jgi:hypothetical protein
MLDEFKIKTTNISISGVSLRKDGSKSIGFEFEVQGTRSNMKDVLKFKKEVGFETPYKVERLEEYCSRIGSRCAKSAGKA